MNTIVINILFSVLLLNICIMTGCYCVQFVEELRERWEKKQPKSNSKDNGQ